MRYRSVLVALIAVSLALGACPPPQRPDPAEPRVFFDRPDMPLSSPGGPAIRLSNSACLGSCPTWRVELRPDGTVLYQGGRAAAIQGERRWQIPATEVARIAQRARQGGFFTTKSSLGGYGLDDADVVISVCEGRRCRSVRALPDKPGLLGALYLDVTEASGAMSYVTASMGTLDRLKADGFDFRSERAGCLLAQAIERRQRDVALALLARGAPVALASRCPEVLGAGPPLFSASFNNDLVLLRALIDRGAVRQTPLPEAVRFIDSLNQAGRTEAAAMLRNASDLTREKEEAIRREPSPYRPQQNN